MNVNLFMESKKAKFLDRRIKGAVEETGLPVSYCSKKKQKNRL